MDQYAHLPQFRRLHKEKNLNSSKLKPTKRFCQVEKLKFRYSQCNKTNEFRCKRIFNIESVLVRFATFLFKSAAECQKSKFAKRKSVFEQLKFRKLKEEKTIP